MLFKKSRLAIALSPLAFVSTGPVLAAEGDSRGMEEIIVTAQKRSENIMEVPVSINAVAGDKLESIGVGSMEELFRRLPGISFQGGVGSNNIILRGLSTDAAGQGVGTDTVGQEATAGVYFGETPITENAGNPDILPFDLERVEVLRGPQGTLYGSGSMGGTIKYIPVAPTLGEFNGKLHLTASGTNSGGSNLKFNGAVNIPVSDTFALRLVGYTHEEEGWVDNVIHDLPSTVDLSGINVDRDDINGFERDGLRLHALFQPSDEFRVLFSAVNQEIKQTGNPAYFSNLPRYQRTALVNERNNDEVSLYSLEMSYDFETVSIKSITSYTDREVSNFVDNSLPLQVLDGVPANLAAVSRFGYKYDTLTQEIRLQSIHDGALQWTLGTFYSDTDRNNTNNFAGFNTNGAISAYFAEFGGPPVPPSDILLTFDRDAHQKQKALFGDVSYAINEQWEVSVGMRWFDYDTDTDEGLRDVFGNGGTIPATTFGDNGSVGKFNVTYKPQDDWMFYATVSEGFRRGKLGSTPTPAPSSTFGACVAELNQRYGFVLDAPVEPDSLTNYELGAKFTALDNRVRITSALYRIDWEDIQINGGDAASDNCRTGFEGNAGAAEVEGLELEITALLADNLEVSLNTNFSSHKTSEPIALLNIGAGEDLPGVADKSWTFSVDYQFEVLGYNSYLNADYSYQGESKLNFNPNATPAPIGGYGLASMRLGVTTETWDASLFVDNLFNKDDAVDSIDPLDVNAPDFYPYGSFITGPRPRTVGLNVKYNF